MKSGFVSLIGRPNTGKSTLLNQIIKEKVAIISPKPQTTRNLVEGIYNEDDTQIIFVDTPGIHKPIDKLGVALNNQAYYSINDVDILLLVVDASVPYGKGDQFIIDKLSSVKKPVFLILNKIDKLSDEEILKKIDEYKNLYEFAEIIPVSALKNDNIDRLIKVLKEYLPDNVKYFMDGETTTAEMEFRLSEIVREKIFIHTNDEVPHSISCKLVGYEEKNNIAKIYIDIIVDRDSLRKIIIGSNGNMIKTIGHEARLDMEELLGMKVYLELYCKTIKKWREKEKFIKDLGYLIKND
ncbi:gTPase Era [Clostridium sp. CAG:524]|jgi:GTP-binding protein Era|nr:gTPase Era [Clostridium sp. CAG:524]